MMLNEKNLVRQKFSVICSLPRENVPNNLHFDFFYFFYFLTNEMLKLRGFCLVKTGSRKNYQDIFFKLH